MVALISKAELGSAIGQPDVDDAQADLAIAYGSDWVEGACGMAFTARTATIELPASLAYELRIPLKPVRAVTAASIAGVAVTDYTVTADGTLYLLYGWRTSYLPEKVSITVQYGTTTTPGDIKGVVAEVSGAVYEGRLGVSAEGVDDYRVQYSGILSEISRATLAKYGARVGSVPVSRT